MKRIIVVLVMILAMVAMLASAPMYAEESTADTTADTTTDTTVTDPSFKEEVQETYHTILSRMGEWFGSNVNVIVPIASGAVLLVATVITFIKNKKWISIVFGGIKKLLEMLTGVNTSQGDVAGKVDGLDADVKAMLADFKALKDGEEERSKMTAAVLVEMTTALEMLQTAYANNRNAPQAFKDIINARYAHCMKLVDSDEDLNACVVAVKHSLEEAHTVDGGGEPDGIKEV